MDYEMRREGGGETECLLDIPEWDFHWQSAHALQTSVILGGSDTLELRCRWDNSPENQVHVEGMQQPSVDVEWGDGSRDEMCLAVLYVTQP